ncbi:uncharacterized protein DUF1206 [Arthrobacter sp. AG1021]|uniref:DUF1206 domain-containing protein n=1 Tax=Arthrobacter sp. AG1021 TaxID=2183908 RepID=UPI000EB042C5|nr:DUF1206 domain-containing protein [Arthrobacter sp. AG1021]RKS12814.1 uncharacterized protein DUF1206 [Arthrobacter sp. AG1021]
MDISSAAGKARQTARNPWFQRAARLGYVANAVLHATLGFLALVLARGGSAEADQSGALQTLAGQPWGIVLLWVCAIGAALLGLWSLAQAALPQPKAFSRLKSAGTGIVFLGLSGAFLQFALGNQSDSGQTTSSFSAMLMRSTAGRGALIALGVVLIGVGGYFVYRGITRGFLKDLQTTGHRALRKAITVSGVVGYPAKGLVLAAVGLLFIVSTVQGDPEESTGIDGALKALGEQQFGPFALVLVGAGLLSYALFLVFRSRFDTMED